MLRLLPWLALPATLLAASCRDPTQITVRVTTDLACKQTPGLAKAWVASSGTEVEAPDCTTQAPVNYVGSIVIVPGPAGDDAKVDVTVIGSVSAASNDKCLTTKTNVGDCLVVRRRLSFIPHTPLTLPVRLDSRCLNVQCKDDTETCIDGVCRSVDVNPPPPPPADAGAPDVGLDAPPPAPVPLDALDLFAGNDGTCARLKNGDIVCWGHNGDDQLLAKAKPVAPPEMIASLAGATEIALGQRHGCADFAELKPPKLRCWGDNSVGQLANTSGNSSTPADVPLSPGVLPYQLHAGKDFTCLLLGSSPQLSEPKVACWGDDGLGQSSGSGNAGKYVITPTVVPGVAGTMLALGDDFACVGRGATGLCQGSCPIAKCWGNNALNQSSGLTSSIAAPTDLYLSLNVTAPTQISAGASHVILALPNGRTYGWGTNADAQLPGPKVDPVKPIGPLTLTDGTLALGAHHSCTLVKGAVTCVGTGSVVKAAFGQDGVKKLVSGANHACVIDLADHVQCWGDNQFGQLGSTNPVDVGPRVVTLP